MKEKIVIPEGISGQVGLIICYESIKGQEKEIAQLEFFSICKRNDMKKVRGNVCGNISTYSPEKPDDSVEVDFPENLIGGATVTIEYQASSNISVPDVLANMLRILEANEEIVVTAVINNNPIIMGKSTIV